MKLSLYNTLLAIYLRNEIYFTTTTVKSVHELYQLGLIQPDKNHQFDMTEHGTVMVMKIQNFITEEFEKQRKSMIPF